MSATRLLGALAGSVLLIACGGSSSSSEDEQQQAPAPQPPAPDPDPADPIVVGPTETWTWVDFPESICGNGTPTGLGVNFTSRSSDLVVFFAPGGACWDFVTCFVLRTAVDVESGYAAGDFAAESITREVLWNRDDAENPFRDANYVFVPYCTGDIFAGDAVRSYDPRDPDRKVHHRGARNVQQFVDRLAATFPQAANVWLTGSSAGGYGVQLNYERFAAAFPLAQVNALADCSPVVQPQLGFLDAWKSSWNPQVPEGCEGRSSPGGTVASCTENLPALVDFLATRHPQARFGLLAFTDDQVIRSFFGYSPVDASFSSAVAALLRDEYDLHPNAEYFVLGGDDHVMLNRVKTLVTPGGEELDDWVRAWATGVDWKSVR